MINRNTTTPISRVGQRRQIVIPQEVCETVGLREGDFVEVASAHGTVVIRPKKLVDADDVLTPNEATLVRMGETQLKRGKRTRWEDAKRTLKP